MRRDEGGAIRWSLFGWEAPTTHGVCVCVCLGRKGARGCTCRWAVVVGWAVEDYQVSRPRIDIYILPHVRSICPVVSFT